MEKRLYRTKDDRILSGLLGGIARYLDVDPAIVRMAFILVCLVQPVFIVGYFLMAFVVPEEENAESESREGRESRSEESGERRQAGYEGDGRTKTFFGALLIGAGIYIVAEKYVHFPFGLREVTGLLLAAIGAYVILKK